MCPRNIMNQKHPSRVLHLDPSPPLNTRIHSCARYGFPNRADNLLPHLIKARVRAGVEHAHVCADLVFGFGRVKFDWVPVGKQSMCRGWKQTESSCGGMLGRHGINVGIETGT